MLPQRAARALVIAVLACGCKGESPRPSPGSGVPPAVPTPPAVPVAAAALAKAFATDVVGDITPVAPSAGVYAMALTMTFETFVTTELRINDSRTGALRLTLAPDGTTHACVGMIHHSSSMGQFHYEKDPAKRKHSESDDSHLSVLAGTWKLVDGIAVIQLDRSAGATCDASKATGTAGTPITELHCIGVTGSGLVPAGSLVCQATESRGLLGLGMPMTEASRVDRRGPDRAPTGNELVLGAPGVVVEVKQARSVSLPVITFATGNVPLVETDYVTPRR